MDFSTPSERNKNIGILAIVAALLFVGGGIISNITPWLMGPQASTQARAVDGLMRFMLFVGGMIFLLVQGLIVWAVIFYRRREGDDSDGPNIHGNYALEFVWTLIPTIIVFILTVYSYQVYVTTREEQDDELIVKVTAQRFAFGFEYEDAASGEIINENVIRTYVGRPVKLEMGAEDVIHALWIPAMRVKQDMMPGRQTELRFTPIEPGRYPVVCTELCGGGHGGMRAEVLVYPDEESYLGWYDTILDCALNPPEDPATRGRAILSSGKYPCAGCHVLDDLADQGWVGISGPAMNGIADRAVERAVASGDADAEAYIRNSIWHSADYIVPGYQNIMPVFEGQMPEDELDAITAYLLTQGSEPVEFEPACPVPDFDDVMAAYNGTVEVAAASN